MADETLRFDIIGNDRASSAFSRAGESAGTLSRHMDEAARSSAILDEALKKQNIATRASADASLSLAKADGILAEAEHVLRDGALEADFALKKQGDGFKALSEKAKKSTLEVTAAAEEMRRRFPELKVKIDTAEAKRKLAILDADTKTAVDRINKNLSAAGGGGIFSKIGGMFGGAGGGAGGAAGGAGAALPGGLPLIGGMGVPGAVAAAVAAIAALPFIAQQAASGITVALGGALAGIGVMGAMKTKSVKDSFASLKKEASADLAQIGKPFVPVMNGILRTAKSTMDKLTPVFRGAERVIAGPFRQFGDTLIKSFSQPAVRTSIDAVAVAFGKLLNALTPQLPGMIKSIANGITNIAHAVSANPKAFADFVSFLFKVAGAALNTIAWLTRVASYIEAHFGPAMHRVAVIFDGVRHEIAHVWTQIFENTIGTVIRLGHDVERDFNNFRHRTAVVFDGVRHDVAHYWDMTWSNTVGRAGRGVRDVGSWMSRMWRDHDSVMNGLRRDSASIWGSIWNNTIGRVSRGISDVVHWFGRLPGWVSGALHSLAGDLFGIARWALQQLLAGARSQVGGITGFFSGFAHGIVGIFKKIWGWFSPSRVMYEGGKSLMEGLAGGIKDHAHKAQAAATNVAYRVGAGVQQWAGTVARALSILGLPQSLAGRVLYQMKTESGGDPNAQNNWDINALEGHPSQGLMQVIPSTFSAYHVAGTSWNIRDPLANVAAAINYARHVYGPSLGALGSGHGYAFGTLSAAPGWGWVGERGPELMHFRGGEQVIPAARASAGNTYNITVSVPPGSNMAEAGRVTVEAIKQFEKRSGAGWRS